MRILVAEPDRRMGNLIKRNLRLWGHEMEIAETGKGATEAFLQRWFDLVLLDLNMPDMSGEVVISCMKKICLNAKLVVMTEKNSRELEARIRKQGILYYMIKPLEWEGLRVMIEHIAKKKNSHDKRAKEVTAMEQQKHFQEVAIDKEGICITCESLAACGYHRNHQQPITFCEEFNSGMNPSEMREDRMDREPWNASIHPVADKEKYAMAYIGLCKHCEKLFECQFVKPGGGMFHCESFKERRANN